MSELSPSPPSLEQVEQRRPAAIRFWLMRLGPGLFVLWLFIGLGSFYLVQKPFTPVVAGALLNVLLDLFIASWLGLLGLGLGHRLWRWLAGAKLSSVSTGELLILGSGLGLGGLGLGTLGLGLAGLFYRWFFITLSFILTLLLWPDFLALRRRLRRWRPAWPNRLMVIYLTVTALLTLFTALLPPADWDGLFYHLTGPKIFIAQHSIRPGLDVPHFNFPFLAEMLFTYALLLRGDIAAKLMHTLYGLLLAGLVYLTARRHLSRASAWPAVLILLSMPMVVTLAGWAYNDLMLAFYQLAALYALLNYQLATYGNEQLAKAQIHNSQPTAIHHSSFIIHHSHWLVLSGILAGLAMGLKYTSLIGPLTLGLILLWWLVRKQLASLKVRGQNEPAPALPTSSPPHLLTSSPLRFFASSLPRLFASSLPHLLTSSPPHLLASSPPRLLASSLLRLFAYFAGPAILIALPWYLKNYFFTGNPVYPFLAGLFDGVFWDQFRAAGYAQAGTGIGWDGATLLQLPFLVTLGLRDVNYFDGRTGPLFLVFLPLMLGYGLFRYRVHTPDRPAALDILLFFGLAQFLFWTLGVIWSRPLWQSRLLLPGLAALCPVVGWLWQDLVHLEQRHFSIHRFVSLLIGLVLLFNLVELGLNFARTNPLAYLSGYETRSENLTRRLGAYYAAMEQLNQTLPPEAVVLFLWEPRSYFCQVECRPDSILDQLAHDQYLYGEAAGIARAWQAAGITHVLLHRSGEEFIKNEGGTAADQAVIDQMALLERQHLEKLFDVAGAYQLYQLR